MAISKLILNGEVQMDVTSDTVEANKLLSGETATKNDGTKVTGTYIPTTFSTQSKSVSPTESVQNVTPDTGYDGLSKVTVYGISSEYIGSAIPLKSSTDLTANGSTVTAPAGYYSTAATKNISGGSAIPPAVTITKAPTFTMNSATGVVTASYSGSSTITPTVTAGYISQGTAGTISTSGTSTYQLTSKAAATIYPSTADQTIASYRWLTGTQTIKSVTTSNLTAANIKSGVVVRVGDATNSSRITQITGTYSAPTPTISALTVTPTTTSQTFNATGVSGYKPVTVNAIPSSYIIPTGTSSITSNGVYDIGAYKSVDVNVAGGNTDIEDGLITRTLSGEYTNSRILYIGSYAFYYTKVSAVNFPNVTTVSSWAFQYARSLVTASFPICKVFHQSAFAGASRLTTIYCPSITSISAYCFDGCSSLSSIDAPNLTVLGDTAFRSCTALTTVNFPNFKGAIPYATFSACTALNNVSFGSVKGIGSSAFFACRSLTSISFPYATYISTNAFCYCSALSTVVNMDHLMSVHGMAFYSCSQLSNFDAPNLEKVSSNAFAYTGFDNISFRYLTGIGSYAFSNCSNLENVNLSYLSYAGTSGIFYRCSNLRSFVAPRLEYFGGEMFSECGLSIAYVRGWIGNNVFMSCSSLTTVVYQDGFVRSCYMANNAFRYSPVSTIYLLATSSIVALYSSTALSNTAITSTTGYIGVPESMYNTYISAYGWSYFSEIIMPLTDSMINTILANAPKPPRYIEREVRDTGLPWTITADFSSFLNGETINVHLVVATESSGQPIPVDVCNHQFVWGDDSYIFTLSAAGSTLQCTIDVTNSSFKLQLVSGTNYGTYFLIIEALE